MIKRESLTLVQVMTKAQLKKNPYDVEQEVESFHWWFVARRRLLKSLLSSIDTRPEYITLDIGCGVGSNLAVLESAGLKVIGLDRSIYALSLAKGKLKLPLINCDLNKLAIRSESVGLIIAMDVLEHLEDDVDGIQEIFRTLKERGILIVTVPAFKFLWGVQDVVTGHKRRYTRRDISRILRHGGFEILRSSYFNFFLFFPILFGRRIIRFLKLRIESENKINSPCINIFLKAIFSLEVHLLKYFSFPFGVSIFCIVRKNEET